MAASSRSGTNGFQSFKRHLIQISPLMILNTTNITNITTNKAGGAFTISQIGDMVVFLAFVKQRFQRKLNILVLKFFLMTIRTKPYTSPQCILLSDVVFMSCCLTEEDTSVSSIAARQAGFHCHHDHSPGCKTNRSCLAL